MAEKAGEFVCGCGCTRTKPTMSVQEAAVELGLSDATVYGLVKAGVLPSLPQLGKRVRIPVRPFHEWIDSHKPTGQDAA